MKTVEIDGVKYQAVAEPSDVEIARIECDPEKWSSL